MKFKIDVIDVGCFKFDIRWETTLNWGTLNEDCTVLKGEVQ
jgi:hypothetical protein